MTLSKLQILIILIVTNSASSRKIRERFKGAIKGELHVGSKGALKHEFREGVIAACKKVKKKTHPNQTNLLELLKLIAKSLNKAKITWYLSNGSLLGAMRDEKFVPWDQDQDITIPVEDSSVIDNVKVALKENNQLEKKKYILRENFGNKMFRITPTNCGDSSNKDANSICCGKYIDIYLPPPSVDLKAFVNNLTPVDCLLEGAEMKCPQNAKQMLVERYGVNWKIPDHVFEENEWKQVTN